MRQLAGLAALLIPLVVASGAEASSIPSNTYVCMSLESMTLVSYGDIEISGDSYRGPAFDGDFGPSYGYDLREDGHVTWQGPLGGLTSDGNTVTATIFEDGVIDIQVMSRAGNPMAISCEAD